MKQASTNHIEIGTELIPGNALPVTCKKKDEEEIHKGLYIPSITALNIPASLLMPKKIYRRERNLQVFTGETPLEVRAGYLVQDTALFDRFEFTTITDST